MKILLIDNYDSFTYNLFHYISNFKKNVDVIRNDKIDSKTILRKGYDKVVISPGPGNPNQAGNCLKIVKDIHKKIPILGVCLGTSDNWSGFRRKNCKGKKLNAWKNK
jgi:anthranilate synthase component 2